MGRENQKRPAILVCPGGGYANVCEREAEPIALQFLPAGYNVFVLTYSVVPYTFPAQLREVAATMELIYQNADQWHTVAEVTPGVVHASDWLDAARKWLKLTL